MSLGWEGAPQGTATDLGYIPDLLSLTNDAEDTDQALSRIRMALDLSPVPALLVGRDGTIQMTNAPLDRLFGYTREALQGHNLQILIPPAMRDGHDTAMRHYVNRPASRRMGQRRDLFGQHADGSYVPVEVILSPIEIEGQRLTCATIRDLNDTGDALTRLRETLDASDLAMFLLNGSQQVEIANTAAGRIFTTLPAKLLGQPISNLIPGFAPVPDNSGSVPDVLPHSPYSDPEQFSIVGEDGRITPVRLTRGTFGPVSDPRMLVTLFDLTDTIARQRELERHNDHIAALNDELSQFAQSASHDLRAPLATIVGLLDLCLEDMDSGALEECRDLIEKARDTGRQNIRKVEAVLTLARAGLSSAPLKKIDLAQTITRIWSNLTARDANEQAFTLEIDGPSCVMTEAETLEIAIRNLLSNAHAFRDPAKPAPWVSVRLRTHCDPVSILVSDNGPGISGREQARVFEIFRRSASSRGHGLGLPLVQKHVRRLGGTVSFFSTPEGTSFILTFPGMEAQQ